MPNPNREKLWILTAQCPSRLGTVDVVTRTLAETENYIVAMNSFDDKATESFCIRVEFRPLSGDSSLQKFRELFEERTPNFDMSWELTEPDHKTRVAVMVSKYDHCLNDLLYRYRTGELAIDIPVIISNHPDLKHLADWHGIPYYHLPITPETKAEQEAEVWKLVNQYDCELVVLARYMQVLSPDMSKKLDGRAINIHHSLLPGFKGAKPYHQAWAKGVKLVGATAHYVNDNLDEGPIITQGVQAVDHNHYPDDLVAKGQDIESQTLARAVRYHTEKRVFLNGNRTVVFND
ncbi:formyltetrahydrofolate deformylase [Hahella sp. CCB-MM4]|uniref:formyltetrahydrofolate deformylase n=1 Tax=Hahella sp. (strain CCB-MM4) TaxID=1926491 RepID=UPI000B9C1268|nr:formyltetrahydrofolate deformylase [Hahella sp. CCB-MM4]OZG73346.1 formyltetrahydrofolate deformylase [Hahella sp. CCB-MM4]